MATIKKVKKAMVGTTTSQTTKKPLSDKDSINIYANRYDKFSASAAGKLGAGKNASKDLKSMKEARANENRLSKKVYGTTPSQKMGGKVKKAKDGDETPFQMYAKKTGRTDTLPGNDSRGDFGWDRGTPMRKAKEAAYDATYGKGNVADDEARVPFTRAGKKSLAKTLSGLKRGGSVKKSASKKSMKTGGKMSMGGMMKKGGKMSKMSKKK